MKTVNTIVKILAAMAAITGIVYVIATYGDKIVAWAKKMLASCPCNADVEIEAEIETEEAAEEAVEEAVEEPVVEEVPVEEVIVEENEPVAEESDFAE